MMKIIDKNTIASAVEELCITANQKLGDDVIHAFHTTLQIETSPMGKQILQQLIQNAEIAENNQQPLCQDTGFAVFFVELGHQVSLDCDLESAINEGVRRGYQKGYLRKSIVSDPFSRVNTKDNTPAVVHIKHVMGDKLKITFAPKGGGSENMSRLQMLVPAQGLEGVKQFVLDSVEIAGANPCPPIIVGVGVGGTFEKASLLAKQALLREIGSVHPDPFYAALEEELLTEVNKLGIGPAGLGGRTTALAVFVDTYPCHIASLPVAVNIQCHSARHKTVEL